MEKATEATAAYYKRDFWVKENLNYVQPHYRLEKAARLVNRIARHDGCDLLDVGCGPATLKHLLRSDIRYFGIDIAIHNPAPNLIQTDFLQEPISFSDKKFDIILAQGIFEYVGAFQSQKFAEINRILMENGTFIVSYVNFNHHDRQIYAPYNNVQQFEKFRDNLARFFNVDRYFPTSHHWHHHEPNRRFMKRLQMRISVNIPFISSLLAVEYFFICSKK